MIRWLAPLLGTLVLVLSSGVAVLVADRTLRDIPDTPVHGAARMPLAAQPDAQAVTLLPGRHPAIYFAAITDRPLFAPTRRPGMELAATPTAPPQPVSAVPSDPTADVQLLGTIMMGERASALLVIGNQPPSWIGVGTVVAGFKLSGVGPDWAELASDTKTVRLDLYPQ